LPQFRSNLKWSDRVRNTFLDQGKLWNKSVESRVKYLVAQCILNKPDIALNQHKRNSIDALVNNLEDLITS
jgi:hypothetical protein